MTTGSDLGLEKGPVPRMTASCGNGSRDDYAFIHTGQYTEQIGCTCTLHVVHSMDAGVFPGW